MSTQLSPMGCWARGYAQLGLSVIPLCYPSESVGCAFHGNCHTIGKRPILEWAQYQEERPSMDDITSWWTTWPKANIGIVTGAVSNLVVVDIDSKQGREFASASRFPRTLVAFTGKGYHLYYKHPGDIVPNATNWVPGIDIRGDGGYVVAPPSEHYNGRRYRWDNVQRFSDWKLTKYPLTEFSKMTVETAPPPTKFDHQAAWRDKSNWFIDALLHGVDKGYRNDHCARMAGYLLRYIPDYSIAEMVLLEWNARNRPPMRESEVCRTLKSIAKTARRKGTLVVMPEELEQEQEQKQEQESKTYSHAV